MTLKTHPSDQVTATTPRALEPAMWGTMRWISSSLHDRAGKALARMRYDKKIY